MLKLFSAKYYKYGKYNDRKKDRDNYAYGYYRENNNGHRSSDAHKEQYEGVCGSIARRGTTTAHRGEGTRVLLCEASRHE